MKEIFSKTLYAKVTSEIWLTNPPSSLLLKFTSLILLLFLATNSGKAQTVTYYSSPSDPNSLVNGVSLSQYNNELDILASRIITTNETTASITYHIDYSYYGIFGENLQKLIEELSDNSPFPIQATADLKGALVTTPNGKVTKRDLSHAFLWKKGIKP